MTQVATLPIWRDHGAEFLLAIGLLMAVITAYVSTRIRSKRQMRAAELFHDGLQRSKHAMQQDCEITNVSDHRLNREYAEHDDVYRDVGRRRVDGGTSCPIAGRCNDYSHDET